MATSILLIVHPKIDYFMPMEWETWDLHINGLEEVQFLKLMNITSELRKFPSSNKKVVTASYIIDGAGAGKFPPISAIKPFLKEIKNWGYELAHCSCPGPDEFSMCILQRKSTTKGNK